MIIFLHCEPLLRCIVDASQQGLTKIEIGFNRKLSLSPHLGTEGGLPVDGRFIYDPAISERNAMQELNVGREVVDSRCDKVVRAARQRLLDHWDGLQKVRRSRGVTIPNRLNNTRPVKVTMEGSAFVVCFGETAIRTRLYPCQSGTLQSKEENRMAVEAVLKKIIQNHPELEALLLDYAS